MDKLFDTKRRYLGYDDEEYVNMCIPVIDVSGIEGNTIEEASRDCNGRIDTFTWRNVAKDFDMIDMVMYANHIFNPFSIKEGEILNVPLRNEGLYRSSDEPVLPDGTKHSVTSKGRKEMTYAETVAYLARKGLGLK